MAESAEDPSLYWIEPDLRGIIPLDRFHVSSRLARTVRSDRFTVTVNRDFDAVMDGCAEPQTGRPRTWINERIRSLYRKLHERRHCHSVEVYRRRRARRRALRRRARPRLLRREHVPPRARRLEGRAGASGRAAEGRRLPAARHPVRHRPSQDRSARSRCRGGSITSCWKRRCRAKAISPRSTSARRSGAQVLAQLAGDRRTDQRKNGKPAAAAAAAAAALRGGGVAAAAAPAVASAWLAASAARCGAAAAPAAGASAATIWRAASAVGQPEIVDRVLDRVQAGARRRTSSR